MDRVSQLNPIKADMEDIGNRIIDASEMMVAQPIDSNVSAVARILDQEVARLLMLRKQIERIPRAVSDDTDTDSDGDIQRLPAAQIARRYGQNLG